MYTQLHPRNDGSARIKRLCPIMDMPSGTESYFIQ